MTKEDDFKSFELCGIDGSGTSPFHLKHDKKAMEITLKYTPKLFSDNRGIVSDKYRTVSEATIGEICKEIKRELEGMHKAHQFRVNGEPTLHPRFFDILKTCRQKVSNANT